MSTLRRLLNDLVEADPDAPIALDRVEDGFRAVSRAQLHARARAVQARLAAAGVGPGDCVAVWLPNWSDALSWQFGAAARGAHVIGLNTRYNVEEVGHVLNRARPRVVAVAAGFHGLDLIGVLGEAVRTAQVPAPFVVPVSGPGKSEPDAGAFDLGGGAAVVAPLAQPAERDGTGLAEGDGAVLAERDGPESADRDGSDLAVAFTTSGSTGLPKLAAHREDAVVAHARADAAALGLGEGDVAACVLPLSGVFGFCAALAAVAGGAACLLEPVFDPAATVAAMAEQRATHLVGGDDMAGRLLDAWRERPVELPALRWLGLADFLGRSAEVAAWAAEFGASTTGVYGSSEVFALALLWPESTPVPRRWSGGGLPVSPQIRVRTADPHDDRPVADGEQGELQFAGPTVVDAYLGGGDAGARTADGWFRTGDLAVRSEDGGIEYVCRMGDVLRLSGFLVAPAEIEHRLAAHEAVSTAKVVGARTGNGVRAVAFVVLTEPAAATPAELREWCAATLAKFKVPARVRIIDEMPTTSGTNGAKIRAAQLREWAENYQEDADG